MPEITRAINAIVIHCAATPNGRPFRVDQIDAMHAQRCFHRSIEWCARWNPPLRAIGYHWFIGVDGSRASGRHPNEIGAHVQGSNARSLGICMAGTNAFTSPQWLALKWLVLETARRLAAERLLVPIETPDQAVDALKRLGVSLLGHRDYSPDLNGDGIIEREEWVKECPGFDVAAWISAGMAPLPGHIC